MRRRALRLLLGGAALGLGLLLLAALVALVGGWRAFGQRASGARLERMKKSPQWKDGHFENPQPLRNDVLGSFTAALHASPDASPAQVLQAHGVDPAQFAKPPEGGLRVTWFGHSSALVELDGHRILTDPVWSERVSPLTWVGPRRWFPVPLPLAQLPTLDAVVISHDHYDHLDMPTVVALAGTGVRFVVPLGVGAHLESWGVPAAQVTELDWWESFQAGDLRITMTPARHASGRSVWDKDATLWAGYALLGPTHRVYYSGDTGLFPAMKEIGERLGPFDLTMIEAGQYHQAWPDWHIGPEQAVLAHTQVKGRVLLPVHWAALMLAFHGWTEPMERVLAAAGPLAATVRTPQPGESFFPAGPPLRRWWPVLPWLTAAQDPIVSSQLAP